MIKENGDQDDAHLVEIMLGAAAQYKTRLLPTQIDQPFVKLLEGIQKVVDQAKEVAKRASPGELQHGPLLMACVSPLSSPSQKRATNMLVLAGTGIENG